MKRREFLAGIAGTLVLSRPLLAADAVLDPQAAKIAKGAPVR